MSEVETTNTEAKKLRLVQITANLESRLGGPVQVVINATRYLSLEYEIKLFVFGNCDIANINCASLPTIRNNRYGFIKNWIPTHIRSQLMTADLLLIHGFYLFSTLLGLAIANRGTIFIMPHGSLELYQRNNSRLKKIVFDLIFKFFNRIRDVKFLVGSIEEVKSVEKRFPRNKIIVVGLGIERVPTEYLHLNEIHEPVRLLCFSRISNKKRIDLCIEVVMKLREKGIESILTIAGDGDEKLLASLMSLVENLNLEKSVKFIGFVEGESKQNAFKNSDIFILPSENENFAIAVAEAIGHQVPVVISKHVAMQSFVRNHGTGIVIENLQVEDLADAIMSIKLDYSKFWHKCTESRALLEWDNVISIWVQNMNSNLR